MKNFLYLSVICFVCFVSSCQGITYDDNKGQGFTLTTIPKFEIVNNATINVSGAYLNGNIIRDTQTNVLYVFLTHGSESYSFPLLNADGKPREFKSSFDVDLIISERGFTLTLGNNEYYHGRILVDRETKVQYVLFNRERAYYAFPLLDSHGVPILFKGELN